MPIPKLSKAILTTIAFLLPTLSYADLSGVYVSQFSADDPQASAGGIDPVYLVVVDKGGTSIATVNADYTHPTAGWTSKVWTYAIVSTADLNAGATISIVDSFGVCDNTVRVTVQNGNIGMQSLSTSAKLGVANPLNINCGDIYPVPLSRTFIPLF